MNWFTVAFQAVAKVFGFLEQREINKPADQKRTEVQTIRQERNDEINYNADAVKYGVDPVTGRVLYPNK